MIWTSPVLGLECFLRRYIFYKKDFNSFFDRKMAWFDRFYYFDLKAFYLKHSNCASKFYWFRSNYHDWPVVRQDGRAVKVLDCQSKKSCVRGFECHLCLLVFKITWTELGKHNNWFLPNLLITHHQIFQIIKFYRIGSQFFEISLSRLFKQINLKKFSVCSWRKSVGQCYTFFFWSLSSNGFLKTSGFFCRVFPQTNSRFSMEAIQN